MVRIFCHVAVDAVQITVEGRFIYFISARLHGACTVRPFLGNLISIVQFLTSA